MKIRHTLLWLFFCLLSVSGFGQYRIFYFGFKAAPQIDWMRTSADGYKSDGTKIGFSWGFVGEYAFSENHHLVSGFNVIFNGGKLTYPYKIEDGTEGKMASDYNFKWLEIPFSLKMKTNPVGKFSFFGQIGLGTAINLQAKVTQTFNSAATTSLSSVGIHKNFEKTTVKDISFLRESLIIGGGVEYKFERGTIVGAQLIFNNGFTDILTGKNNATGVENHGVPNSVEIGIFTLL